MNLRYNIKNSTKQPYLILRRIYYSINHLSLPAPKILWRFIWEGFKEIRGLCYWLYCFFWVTPMYKGFCEKVGRRFTAGTYLPFVIGSGKIFLGDRVKIHGKIDFVFGSILPEKPEIHVGDRTGIGHNVRFDISSKLVIGKDCLIAKDVAFHDSSGHQLDPDLRRERVPIRENQVRPITIGNNVWIGDGAYISPGTTIGDNCVISANTIVGRKIPSGSLVYSPPAKVNKIRKISNMV